MTEPAGRISIEAYRRLGDEGVLGEDHDIDLLDGWLVKQHARTPPHAAVQCMVGEAFFRHLPEGWRVRFRSGVTLPTSELRPDIVVAIGPAQRYRDHHPTPDELALLVEIADLSLDLDRNTKGPLYAQAGIPIYWIVNVVDWVVEVYTQPTAAGYAQRQDYQRGDTVPLVIAGQAVAQVPVVELLG